MISGGNPSGYSGNGSSSRIPIISQCPVVVSLPAERSVARPCAVPAAARGATPSIGGQQAQAERLERRSAQSAHRRRGVGQGVRAVVPVGVRIGRLTDAPGVADDDQHLRHERFGHGGRPPRSAQRARAFRRARGCDV